MPVSYTRSDLINQAATDLFGAESVTPSDGDVSTIDHLLDGLVAELSALDIYTVDDAGTEGPNDGAIDPAAFRSLAYILANYARASFSDSGNAEIEGKAQEAMMKLRTLAAPPRALTRLRVDSALRSGTRGASYSNWSGS